jgi:acyl carrier protein
MSKKLYQIVSKVFNIDIDKISDESSSENLEEWDSFNFYVLLDEIENEFDIKFDLDETLDIKKIGDIKKLFVKYGVKCE